MREGEEEVEGGRRAQKPYEAARAHSGNVRVIHGLCYSHAYML